MTRESRTALLLAALLAPFPHTVSANQEIADREGAECVTCHVDAESQELTDEGMFYELMGSFEGFELLQEKFDECTACHVGKPGSKELTYTGEKYKWVADDMEGIRVWLMQQHPAPAENEPAPESESDPGEGRDVRDDQG